MLQYPLNLKRRHEPSGSNLAPTILLQSGGCHVSVREGHTCRAADNVLGVDLISITDADILIFVCQPPVCSQNSGMADASIKVDTEGRQTVSRELW